jgi:DNA polymerase III epsilon subunit-like protein
MYLFFDTETAGLPRNWEASHLKYDNWPRLVQIAWIQYDEDGNEVDSQDFIIRPDGFKIPHRTTLIHGITTARAMKEGVYLVPVLELFNQKLSEIEHILAHNISFDERVMGAEFVRNGLDTVLFDKKRICTMKSTTTFCQIPGSFGFKWPSLAELHYAVFEKDFVNAHNAKADIEATANCYWELKRRGFF